ncbi:hypothetical protein F5144DRAFT_395169 [Chaetomium tenue]|uniref:Uncharacterized protein n=1 Tax=Chaetomium tenue TaxID=1854479 RepID=A0ACB7NYM3_9PEZI|nr:hypothetical protein F5144DRAFT_395169 [Chaetomium globosum]
MPRQRYPRKANNIGSYNENDLRNKAWADPQPGEKTGSTRAKHQPNKQAGPTRAKRQRRQANAPLAPSPVPAAPPPDAGIASFVDAVAAPSPDHPPPPNSPPPPHAVPNPNAPRSPEAPSSPDATAPTLPGSVVIPSTNSIAPLSPGVGPANPRTGGGNQQAPENAAKKRTFNILETTYGSDIDAYHALDFWEELDGAIRWFVKYHMVKVVDWDTLDASIKERLTVWAPFAQRYLAYEYDSYSIFEGWIWRTLFDRVFNQHDHELWEGYGRLKPQLHRKPFRPLVSPLPSF